MLGWLAIWAIAAVIMIAIDMVWLTWLGRGFYMQEIGGLLLDEVGGVPEEGESAEVDGFRLTVLVMDGRRVERVRVERIDPSLGNGRNAQGDP